MDCLLLTSKLPQIYHYLFNFSLQCGIIPDIWKHVSVVPVFKKGSPGEPYNYRPISLTCIACKLTEAGIKMLFLSISGNIKSLAL